MDIKKHCVLILDHVSHKTAAQNVMELELVVEKIRNSLLSL